MRSRGDNDMVPQRFPFRRIDSIQLLGLSLVVSILLSAGRMVLFPQVASADTDETSVQRLGIKVEYPVPDGPVNVAWESPGRSWFTSPSEDMVGVVTRQSNFEDELIAVRIEYVALDTGSQPYDVAVSGDNVWFTLMGSNQFARFDLTTVASTGVLTPTAYYDMPTDGSGPTGIAVAPDGMVWIVAANTPALTRFDPVNETFEQWSFADKLASGGTVSTSRTYPDVATNHGNQIWLTVPGSNRVLGFEVDTATFSSHSLNNLVFPASEPAGITVDNRAGGPWGDGGYPWITAYDSGVVGRFAPGTLSGWQWFQTSSQESGPRGIAFRALRQPATRRRYR
jgi:streptogramin lyase